MTAVLTSWRAGVTIKDTIDIVHGELTAGDATSVEG
jgi:hypothetical protein